MKNKISRILGVVLTLALLSSLVLVAVPVSAGTQAWSTMSTPSATGLVLDAGNTFTGPWDIDINDSAIYAASNVGGTGGVLVKSTDGGRTWTNLTGLVPAYNGMSPTITDIVTSSIDANTVYVTDGFDIYKTTDGGTTWVPLSNLFGSGAGAAGLITSIDVGYLGTNPYIFAATSTFTTNGGAYVAQEAVWGMPWADLLIGTDRPTSWGPGDADVLDIMVDPVNFGTTQMVMALVTNYDAALDGGPDARITTKYGGAQWDATVNDVALPGVGVATLYSGSLWLPDNFNSSLASGNMQAFAGVDSGLAGVGDAFLAVFGVPAAGTTAAFDLNIRGAGSFTEITGLDGTGPIGTAQLLASGFDPTSGATRIIPVVYRSLNGGFTWSANTKGPAGGATPLAHPGNPALSSVLVLNSSTALVGTHGTDGGVSITNDFGRTWNGLSLLNTTTPLGSIDDLELGSLFMTTNTSTAAGAVWRNDGTNWERVFSASLFAVATTNFVVVASPAGDAIFIADIGGTTIYRSTDDGQTWTAQTNAVPGAITGLVVVDANTQVVGGGANTVYRTSTNGGFWFTETITGLGTPQSFDVDPASGTIMVGSASTGVGIVAVSTDNGDTWSVATQTITAIDTTLVVAFGYSYATTGEMYATGIDSGNDAGVWRRTTTTWSQRDIPGGAPQATTDDVKAGSGLVSAPGISGVDMVYAIDGGAGGALDGVYRNKSNRTEGELLALAGATTGLWYEAGSNVLYTILAGTIRTFTDILAVAGTGVAVSAVTGTTATVSWTDLAPALTLTHLVTVNTTAQTNYYTAVSGGPGGTEAAAPNNAANTAALTLLVPNTTYQVSVWVATTDSSFLFSGTTSFTTLPGVPTTPVGGLIPIQGAINIPISGPAFAWLAPAGGALSYDWQLTTDPTFASITEGTMNVAVPYLVWDEPLENETAYYWRVRSVTVAGTSAWVTQVFTTVISIDIEIPPQVTPTITFDIPDFSDLIPDLSGLIPDITLPPVVLPDIILPPVVIPDITLPPVVLPDIILPEIVLPDIILPEIVLPDITVPPAQVTVVPPVVTVTTVPAPVLNVEEVAPAYIWAIVVIGGILVIAVIVLIVRTRRIV